MVHPLGNRPRAWYGPEDFCEGDDPAVETAAVQKKQRNWDAIYFSLNWWQRLLCYFAGEITEPVGSGYEGKLPV